LKAGGRVETVALASEMPPNKTRAAVIKAANVSLSREEVRSVLATLGERLPCNQRLIRVTINQSDEKENDEKEVLGSLCTFCVLDKLRFLLDFRARMNDDGVIDELEVNGVKMKLGLNSNLTSDNLRTQIRTSQSRAAERNRL
jgi:hypothetical protein